MCYKGYVGLRAIFNVKDNIDVGVKGYVAFPLKSEYELELSKKDGSSALVTATFKPKDAVWWRTFRQLFILNRWYIIWDVFSHIFMFQNPMQNCMGFFYPKTYKIFYDHQYSHFKNFSNNKK